MPGSHNFVVYNGEDFDRTLTWSDSDVPVSKGGTPVNLTGYTAHLTMDSSSAFITTVSTGNGVITLGGAAGTIRVYMPAAAIGQFANGGVVPYRLFMTAPSTGTSAFMVGNFRVMS